MKKRILNIPDLKFLKIAIEKHPTKILNLEYLDKQDAIAALVLNHNESQALLVSQYRPGAQENLFEIPAGLIEKDENPLETLKREIREETGYDENDYEIIYSSSKPFFVSPGYTSEKIYMYIIKLNSADTKPKPLNLDETEDLFSKWFPIEEIENISNDMKTIFSLYLYKSLR